MEELLRSLPQISKIVNTFRDRAPEHLIKRVARQVLHRYREEIKKGLRKTTDDLFRTIELEIEKARRGSLKRVINATGVIVNTNLGRAPLHEEVIASLQELGHSYSNLEYDLKRGKRGSRNSHVENLLCELTGAQSAFVVNNNAGAVYLVLNSLAYSKEVIVSRGELIEIGGSFRIPDIMRSSGALLKEVGTTNKTHLRDYEEALSQETALVMKVHRSNFYMKGFVEDVSLRELAELAGKVGVPLYYDCGSGLLNRTVARRLPVKEISMEESIAEGADVVSGSGDKLLGGPQAGIILGKKELIDRIKRNPMARALRIDKLTLCTLEATLRLYLEGRFEEIPVINMLLENSKSIRRRARKLTRALSHLKGIRTYVIKDLSSAGGGSLPELELETYCLVLEHHSLPSQKFAELLRESEPPVVGRIKEGKLLLDMRTVRDYEIPLIKSSVEKVLEHFCQPQ